MWGREALNIPIVIAISIIGMLNLRKIEKSDLLIIPIFSLLLLSLARDDGANIVGSISSLFILFFFIIDKKKMLLYSNCFKNIFVIFLFLSLINYVLVLFAVPLDYDLIEPLNPLKESLYRQYPFLVFLNDIEGVAFPRFCGVFDEPGVVGTFSGIMLFADRYNLKKISNVVLFVAGIFSFSFFFIALSFVSMLYFYNNKIRFFVIITIILTFFATKENPVIYGYVWERFEIENGHLKGDNRASKGLDSYFVRFIESDEFLWGKGELVYAESSSYKQFVIDYGLIYSTIILLLLLAISVQFNKNAKGAFLSMLLLLALMYQRPYIFDYAYMFLIVYLFINISNSFNFSIQIRRFAI